MCWEQGDPSQRGQGDGLNYFPSDSDITWQPDAQLDTHYKSLSLPLRFQGISGLWLCSVSWSGHKMLLHPGLESVVALPQKVP